MNPPDYKFGWKLDDGTALTIRTMRPDDALIEQSFVRSASLDMRRVTRVDGSNLLLLWPTIGKARE